MSEETILNVILEKASNVERSCQRNNVQKYIIEQMKIAARRERKAREATIIIDHNDQLGSQAIVNKIEALWVHDAAGPPVAFWSSKTSTFAEFDSKSSKATFLECLASQDKHYGLIINQIKKPNDLGEHYSRLPVRFEIANVPVRVDSQNIIKCIKSCLSLGSNVESMKEGKEHNNTRSIFFKANQKATTDILWKLDGAINIISNETRIKIYPKITARPYLCKDCFTIGTHTCKGKLCANCSASSHANDKCKAKTKTCANCKAKGHRAKETHCPKYLQAVVNEIRKMDIPMTAYEDEATRFIFAKNLIY